MKIFLGGTCNNSKWRDEFVNNLKIDYFNPVVKNWDKSAQETEIKERKECDYCLYVITPKMTGVYSIAELIQDSNDRPDSTIFVFKTIDGDDKFNNHQISSLIMVGKMLEKNGAKWFNSTYELIEYLNGKEKI